MHCYRLSGEGSGLTFTSFSGFLKGEVSMTSIMLRVMSRARGIQLEKLR
jgi:hypothetical protein